MSGKWHIDEIYNPDTQVVGPLTILNEHGGPILRVGFAPVCRPWTEGEYDEIIRIARIVAAAPETARELAEIKAKIHALEQAVEAWRYSEGKADYTQTEQECKECSYPQPQCQCEETDEEYRVRRMQEENITEDDVAETLPDEPIYK